MKFRTWLMTMAIAAVSSGCAAYPRLLNTPFDPGGRSLNSPAAETNPDIAGRYIVFVSEREKRQDIYLYDLQTQRTIAIPGLNSLATVAEHPDVSADGRYIVFAGNRQGRSGIFLYDREIRQLRNVTDSLNATVRNPSISDDGKTIAFEANLNGQWDILVYNRSGQPLDLPTPPR
ncbi:Periplasmic component of the Tol biopolymer transport system [Geitlerinema sp. FC II]|nr:Periplasmic component of the Tol biopolymer transport system [Geitlerinema sp. FC II]